MVDSSLTEESSTGYNYKLVDGGLEHICPICQSVVRDAYQVNCCGKILCKNCLAKCRRSSDNCPACRHTNIGEKHFKDTKSDQQIKSLQVYCSLKDSGCTWIGELRSVEEHVKDCPKQVINCPFADIGCQATPKKEDLQVHIKEDATAHINMMTKMIDSMKDKMTEYMNKLVTSMPSDAQ